MIGSHTTGYHRANLPPAVANSRLSLLLNDDGPGGPDGRAWLYKIRARVNGSQVEILEIGLYSPMCPRDFVASVSEADFYRKAELNGLSQLEVEQKLIWRVGQ